MEKDDFEQLKELGKGSYGTCYKIKRKSDGKVSLNQKECYFRRRCKYHDICYEAN